MDAISTDTTDLNYSNASPLLLAASSASAMARAEGSAAAAGVRVAARLPIEGASAAHPAADFRRGSVG